MTSKERILAALRREKVDYLPCTLVFWSNLPPKDIDMKYKWETYEEMLEVLVNKLGVDAFITVGLERACHPDVKMKTWIEKNSMNKYPLLHKVISTPKGELEAIVRKTEDWPHGDDIPLLSDFNVSRFIKPWIETIEDVEKFFYLWQPPTKKEISNFRENLKKFRKLAERYQIPIISCYTLGLTSSLHLLGAEQGVILSMDNPEVIDRLLEIEFKTDFKVLEILLDSGIDIVERNGWYESCDFWSPSQFEKWVMPYFKKEIEITHQANRPIVYLMCTGIMPLLPLLTKLNFNCLKMIEPALGNQNMDLIVKTLGDKKSFWGGISAPVHIGGKEENVRKAVRNAISIFGKTGFILFPVPSIRDYWPFRNVMVLIEEWKKNREVK